jgi:hypothetical protein
MKNITFSADEMLIEAARERARSQKTTLNEQFRRRHRRAMPSARAAALAVQLLRFTDRRF